LKRIYVFVFIIFSALLIGQIDVSTAAQKVYTFDCETTVYKPTSIYQACGDGNTGWQKIQWQSWNSSKAVGTGLRFWNDCEPYCAAGKFHTFKVSIVLDSPKKVNGKLFLTRIKWKQIDQTKNVGKLGRSGIWNLYEFYQNMNS
jgi:hypothetical protein